MKNLIFVLLLIPLGGIAQQVTVTTTSTELPKTYIVDESINNSILQSYRITNIQTLESNQVELTKVNQLLNINIYETNKPTTENNYLDLYNGVNSGIKRKEVPNVTNKKASIYDEWLEPKKKENK